MQDPALLNEPTLAPVISNNSQLMTVANLLSNLLCPPLVGIVLLLLIGGIVSTPTGWIWVIMYCCTTLILPSIYIYILLQRGQVSDIHIPIRAERIRPLTFTLILAVGALVIALALRAPQLLLIVGAVNAVQSLLLLLITMRWKISLHAMAVAELATFCIYLFGIQASLVALIVPLVSWSRVYLRRHTLNQTIGGSILGALIIFLVVIVV